MTLSRLHLEYRWLIIVPLLLLAGMLAGRRLNTWTFGHDETATVMAAGAREFGPRTPIEAIRYETGRWQDQAFGQVVFVSLWGPVTGWTTVAIRALAWLAGLLTLALVYRVGHDIFHHQAGLFATLLLVGSVLFVSYLHIARVYTFVALFATLLVWCYWRVALQEGAAGRVLQAGLLLGGIGLLYAHYLNALLLVALGLFHLLFVRKDRRWWQVSLLLALIALSAIPEIEAFAAGLELNRERYVHGSTALTSPEATVRLLYMLTNSLVSLPRSWGAVLVLALAGLLMLLVRRRPDRDDHPLPEWYLAMLSLFFVGLVLIANLFVTVLVVDRMRHFMALWPLVALLAGSGLWRLGCTRRRLADGLLVAMVASGLALHLRSDLYLSVDNFEQSYLHLADQALAREARSDDFLLLEERAFGHGEQASTVIREYFLTVWTFPRTLVSPGTTPELALQQTRNDQRVWLLATAPDNAIEQSLAEQMLFCQRPVKRGGLVLTLYARSEANCD